MQKNSDIMESLDLLAREDEFKKLNKQLEKKTESLMKEIELEMQKKDIFAEFSPNLSLSPIHTIKKHNCETYHSTTKDTPQKQRKKKPNSAETSRNSKESCRNVTIIENKGTECVRSIAEKGTSSSKKISSKLDTGTDVSSSSCELDELRTEENRNRYNCGCFAKENDNSDKEFLYAFVSINVKDKVLPQSFLKDRPTVENVCKFLSSKVKLMQEQMDKVQSTLNKKASQCDSHLTQLAELESERMSLLNKCNNMKSSTANMKAKCMALQHRLEEKDRQYIEQRSLADRLSCELKQVRSKQGSLEAKCAAQQQTVDNLTQQLEVVKRTEKEYRDSTRSLSASHQNAISRLEAQLKAQASRINKQMALIDNLRRQNVLLSTEAAVNVLEKEYCDYLEKDF